MTTETEVKSFLSRAHYIISRGSDYFYLRADRPDNTETLIKLGFTPNDAIDVLEKLSYKDYVKGPEENNSVGRNKQRNEEMWFFGKNVKGIEELEIYIKFSLAKSNDFDLLVCVSFHESKFPLEYKFKTT